MWPAYEVVIGVICFHTNELGLYPAGHQFYFQHPLGPNYLVFEEKCKITFIVFNP